MTGHVKVIVCVCSVAGELSGQEGGSSKQILQGEIMAITVFFDSTAAHLRVYKVSDLFFFKQLITVKHKVNKQTADQPT